MSDFDNDTNLSESEIDARIGNSFTNLKILGKLRSRWNYAISIKENRKLDPSMSFHDPALP